MGYFLQNDKGFLERYLGFLSKETKIQISGYKIKTQFIIDAGRVDVAIFWDDNGTEYSLFVEHKVWSSPWEHKDDEGIKKDQITTYCKYQEDHSIPGLINNFVVLISNYLIPGYSKDGKPLPSYLGNYTWSDISNLLTDHVNKSKQQNIIAVLEKEFIEFMRRENMAGFEDFSIAELSSIALYKSYEKKRNSLVTRIHQSFKEDAFKAYKLRIYYSWGGSNIGSENMGAIFHDAVGKNEYDVGMEASLWVFFGLSLNHDDTWFPKSLYAMIPDVIGGFAKWFDIPRELNDFKSRLGLDTWSKEQNEQFGLIVKTDNVSNWISVIKRESLLYFLQREP